MNILKKVIIFFIPFIMLFTSMNKMPNIICLQTASVRKITNVGVMFFNINEPYMTLEKQSLNNIQNEHEDTIKFAFFDGQDNQAVQDAILSSIFNKNFDLLLIDMVNSNETLVSDVVNKAQKNNTPLILFSFELSNIPQIVKSYKRVVFIATDSRKSGIIQGKIIVDKWLANKDILDRNRDDKIQYIMLKGNPDSKATNYRSNYSISTISDSGIATEELASRVCNWDKELAKLTMNSLLLNLSNKVEVIISNNDAMAIGAIEALQKYGYNKGGKTKNIPVFGVDGIPEARELVNKGIMASTVIQDPNELAQALYTVGINLVLNRNPIENTKYQFDKTGIAIEMPYYEYKQ